MHFKYVRFHGLFCDTLGIYSEDFNGQMHLSYNITDQLFDFILSIGLKPMVELSYMPRQLSRSDYKRYGEGNYISYPKSMEKWNCLISSLLHHFEERYGRSEVSGWPFWVWNQPDNSFSQFSIGDEHFLELYKNTYFTIKSINPDIIVGTPAFMSETLVDSEQYNTYEDFWEKNGCIPDFININFYSIQFDIKKYPGTNRRIPILSMDESQLQHSLEAIRRNQRKNGWHITRLNVQEWHYFLGTDLLADTLFNSAYIVKNLMENHHLADNFGYFTLVDFAERYADEDCPFRGDFGLFTYNGIKKCAYYALAFLNRLGSEIIFQNNKCVIVRDGDAFQILLYHYVHYKEAYAHKEYHNITVSQRFHQFEDELDIAYNYTLEHLPASRYLITESTIGRRRGCAYEQWVDIGSMKILSKEDVDYINQISLPLMKRFTAEIQNGCYAIRGKLQPLEVRLIELKPL